MKKIKIQKSVTYRKIKIKSKSNTKEILPSLTHSYTPRSSIRKIISPPKMRSDLIETQVSSATKRLEVDKINLRILKERLNQKRKMLDTLEGIPQKELIKKKLIKYKLHEPIKRAKGREREIIDERIKIAKEKEKNEYDFKKETDEIDNLIQENENLRKEVMFSRKKRLELERIKLKLLQEILSKKNKLKEINKLSHHIEKTEKIDILNKEETAFIQQQQKYDSIKNCLEEEYNKVIQAYIKKEREKINESNFNRKISELKKRGNILKYDLNANKNLEIQEELKKYEDEKIGDRTPILDECLEKWSHINQTKKESINKYVKNCEKIRETLNKLLLCLNLDSYKDLPEIFKKTEERQSNISMKKEKIENENEKLKKEKYNLIANIELIQSKEKGSIEYKNKYIELKKKKIKVIDNLINKFERDIRIKQNFFELIQPETDNFLKKLNNTFVSEFIPNKMDLRENDKYNYLSVNKYLSNIEDYINLVYDWEENNDTDNFEGLENESIRKLNTEMKQKIENFDKYKLINKNLLNSMQMKRKNGFNLNDIIKSASRKIIRPINYNIFNKSKNNKSKDKTTENSEEDNFRFQFDTQSYQQSSIFFQNSPRNKKH